MAPLSTLGLAVLVLSFSSFASVSSVKVEVSEGENEIRVRCTVSNSTGPMRWWKNGKEINTTLDKYREGRDILNSELYSLTFNFTTDDEGSYSCINESDPVELTVKPQSTGTSFNATFDDNGNITIPCGLKIGSITADKELRFSLKNKEKKLEGEFIKEKEGESYNLFLVIDSSEYGSLSKSYNNYLCRIFEGGTKIAKHNFSLRVPPRVIIQGDVDDGDNVILRSTGQSLSVSCNASHPDENSTNTVTKSWKKEGELLSNDSKLVIAHLSPQDSGVYTCFASFEGLEYNKSFNLTVISDLPSPSPSATESPSTTESTMIIDISTTSPAHSAPEVTSTGTPSPTSGTNKSGVFQNPLMYAIIIIVLLIIVMVLLAVMTLCYFLHCCMKRKKQNESESGSSTGDVELQANQTQDSFGPPLTPSVSSSANDRLTIASSSCCDSCRCTPSIAPSSINPNQSDQCSLGHNPKSHMGSVSNNPSHCASTATCTCSCAHSHNLAPPYFTRPPVHGLHPCSHTPLPSHHAFISFKPANPSISNDSGYTCSLHYPPSETGTSRGYPDTRTVCSHCTKSFIISTDSGYRPMKTSSRLPGYSSYNEGTYNEGTHNEGTLC